MSSASGSNHSMAYVAETTYGITPTTPVFKPFRITGTTLGLTKETIQSEELRSDRQIGCFRHGNKQVGGGADFELTFTDFDDLLEAGLCGAWDVGVPAVGTDRLLAGVARRSFTVERHFADITTYVRYKGVEVNEISLSIAPNAVVTGSLTLVGTDQDGTNGIVTGATYGAPAGGCAFDSFSGTITEGGASIAIVTQVDLNIANGIEPQFVIGSDAVSFTSIGRSNVTGTVTAYFSSIALLNKFVNETASSLVFTLVNEAGDALNFNLPNIKYTGGQPDVSGDGPVTVALGFQALYDDTLASQLVIERTAA